MAVSIIDMMSQVCHNVHNVTYSVVRASAVQCHVTLILQSRDHVGRSLILMNILTVGIYNRVYDFFALHISRPRSNYDVRLYSTA